MRVIARHQELMARFLSTQRRVMLTYLSAHAGGVVARRVPRGAASAVIDRPPAVVAPSVPAVALPRSTLSVEPLPAATVTAGLAPNGVVLVIDDGAGVGQALVARLGRAGRRVALVRSGEAPAGDAESIAADLDSTTGVERLLAHVGTSHGRVAALVHLRLLQPVPDEAEWSARASVEARRLFLLAKACRADLEASAGQGGAALVAATGLGGAFGLGSAQPSSAFPGQGAAAGLVKTLALELVGVRARAVDLDPREPADVVASRLEAELWCDDGQVEVGYAGARRVGVRPVPSALGDQPAVAPDASWVWLVTGGARGITADICLELAARYRSTFVLAGRSALPSSVEEAETAGVTDMAALKAAIIRGLKSGGQAVTPAVVDRAYQQLLRDRETRANLEALARTGARVQYAQVDVRDEAALGALVDGVYASFGRLDAVLHGAGIIEDKLVKDKPVESFDRVFETKVRSAFTLSRRLRPESLRALVFFTSVAGRFGNRGQADYAAANEVVARLAWHLDRHWPGRVVAIDWGPWDKLGMVSAELRAEFHRRGVTLIPSAEGRRALDAEVCFGPKGVAEVVVGDGPWGAVCEPAGGAARAREHARAAAEERGA